MAFSCDIQPMLSETDVITETFNILRTEIQGILNMMKGACIALATF